MGPILAAIGGLLAAVMEVTIATRVHVADAHPLLVLVLAIILTVVIGFEEGMAFAFIGGLFFDMLAFRPLGTSIFALLLVVGLAAAANQFLGRARVAGSLIGVAVATPIYILVITVTTGLLRPPAPSFRLSYVAAAIGANLILAAVVAPLLAAIRRRWDRHRRLVW
jgi:rod shape-determining protein MreD